MEIKQLTRTCIGITELQKKFLDRQGYNLSKFVRCKINDQMEKDAQLK